MRRLGSLALLIVVALVADHAPSRAQDAKPAETIRWRGGPDGVIAAADRENRPVFIAVATLADGAGNEGLATRLRDAGVVAAAAPFVCVIASRHRHGTGPKCERYGGTCADHQAVMGWVVGRFGTDVGSLTGPRHLILNPDGRVRARVPFGTGVAELASELERSLAAAAPARAVEFVASARREVIAALRARTTDPREFAKSDDPLAPAVLQHLWTTNVVQRPRWAAALATLPPTAFATVRVALRGDAALLGTAESIDAKRAAWWRRFHGTTRTKEVPPPHDEELAGAFAKLREGDASELDALLDALGHPVDGPEVRAALTGLVGRDLGRGPDAWRRELTR